MDESEPPHRSEWKISKDNIFGCWLWTGRLDRDGYGVIWRKGCPTQAHRVVYETLAGPIEAGKRLDHICRRRNCVRPGHLEPVTESVNQLRRFWRVRAMASKCRAGHDLRLHAMTTPEGGRLCRTCQGPTK